MEEPHYKLGPMGTAGTLTGTASTCGKGLCCLQMEVENEGLDGSSVDAEWRIVKVFCQCFVLCFVFCATIVKGWVAKAGRIPLNKERTEKGHR